MIEQERQRLSKQGLSNLVLQALPHTLDDSLSLRDIKHVVDQNQGPYFPEIYKEQRHLESVRISQLYSAIAKLLQVGLVASTVNHAGDTFETRRYWRAPTTD